MRKLSRRDVVGAVGAMAMLKTANASETVAFNAECDVVVCGGGAGGLATALISRWRGNDVILLEKSGALGGTAAKAAFWYWIPNNKPMRDKGMIDEKDDFLKLVSRLSSPETFDPSAERFGLDSWHFSMFSAFYDSAGAAAELLADKGALPYRHLDKVPDYWAELPENKAPVGRVLIPLNTNEYLADGGRSAIRTLSAAIRRDGVQVRTSHRVVRLVHDESGRVIGVEARDASGTIKRIRARKAVVFACGGYPQSRAAAGFLKYAGLRRLRGAVK